MAGEVPDRIPPWGTPSADEPVQQPEPRVRPALARRLLRWLGTAVVLTFGAALLTVAAASEGDVPLTDASIGVAAVAMGATAAWLLGHAFTALKTHGHIRTGRLLSPVVLGLSVWGMVLAVRYDNQHRSPHGIATPLGEALLLAAAVGIIGGVAGVVVSWTPSRAAGEPTGDQPEVQA